MDFIQLPAVNFSNGVLVPEVVMENANGEPPDGHQILLLVAFWFWLSVCMFRHGQAIESMPQRIQFLSEVTIQSKHFADAALGTLQNVEHFHIH